MEHTAIASFLRHGHIFHLYVYQRPTGIPEGTIVRDANEILPAARIFKYRKYDSYSGFSNFFRYKLLLERGGWWVDMDMMCLRPFRFSSEYVFASEIDTGVAKVTSCAMRAPPGSEIFKYAWQVCETFDPRQLKWGQSGPHLMSRCVEKYALQQFVQPPQVFCPINYIDWESVLNPTVQHRFGEQTYAVHLWNEYWRRAKRDKNAAYHRESLYEILKGSYMTPGVTFLPAPPAPRRLGAMGLLRRLLSQGDRIPRSHLP
jgi:mannosyltransferase OCH1-like enzyme